MKAFVFLSLALCINPLVYASHEEHKKKTSTRFKRKALKCAYLKTSSFVKWRWVRKGGAGYLYDYKKGKFDFSSGQLRNKFQKSFKDYFSMFDGFHEIEKEAIVWDQFRKTRSEEQALLESMDKPKETPKPKPKRV